jgi:Skp family chaperone for outer membrane proteins
VPASPSANAARYGLAVVDISYIFKQHLGFKAKMEGMKQAVEATENQLRVEREQIGKMQERLETFKSGSPEYKQLDDEIAKRKADFNLQASKQRKEFLDQEAKIYFDTAEEISQAVKHYAQQHNIGLVVRFNGDRPDPAVRNDVLQYINRPVVYENNIDITPDVLRLLNSASAANTAQRRGPLPPQPGIKR